MAPNKACLPAAVKLLAGRDHSEQELRHKLSRQGHDQEAIDAAFTVLRSRGYLDDAALTRNLADRYTADGQYGRAGIRARLARRGLSTANIAAALANYDPTQEYPRAACLARSRFPAAVPGEAPTVGRFLASRGFSTETILKILENLYRYQDDQ